MAYFLSSHSRKIHCVGLFLIDVVVLFNNVCISSINPPWFLFLLQHRLSFKTPQSTCSIMTNDSFLMQNASVISFCGPELGFKHPSWLVSSVRGRHKICVFVCARGRPLSAAPSRRAPGRTGIDGRVKWALEITQRRPRRRLILALLWQRRGPLWGDHPQ